MSELYDRATWQEEKGRWEEAYQTLCEIVTKSPGYKDASERLARVKKRKRLAHLRREAERLFGEGDWKEAITKLREAVEFDRRHRILDRPERKELVTKLREMEKMLSQQHQEAKQPPSSQTAQTAHSNGWETARDALISAIVSGIITQLLNSFWELACIQQILLGAAITIFLLAALIVRRYYWQR